MIDCSRHNLKMKENIKKSIPKIENVSRYIINIEGYIYYYIYNSEGCH